MIWKASLTFVKTAIISIGSTFTLRFLSYKWECASLLVDAGANLNHTDCHFGTPLHAAVFKGSINSAKVLLKAGTVSVFLYTNYRRRIMSGCNVNSIKILSTPLHTAARQQDYNIALLLLMFGADPTMKDNYDRRAIDV
ncbi:LOW QUALITY PROTEIN: ASB13-like protein, partial [Mya arenaria]